MSDMFGDFDEAAAEQQLEDIKGTGYFKCEKEQYEYPTRIMPPEPGRKLPWVAVSRHFYTLPGYGTLSHNCPRLMGDKSDPKRCPSCESAAKKAESGNHIEAKIAKEMEAGTRGYIKLIDRENEHNGVQVFEFGVTILRRLAAMRDASKGTGADFTHPTKGIDVNFTKFPKTPWYTVELQRAASKLSDNDEQIMEWLQASIDEPLEKKLYLPTFDEIIALVQSKYGQAPPQQQQQVQQRNAQDAIGETTVVDPDDSIPF